MTGRILVTGATGSIGGARRGVGGPQIAMIMSETLGRTVRPVPVPTLLLYAGIRAGGGPHWQARGMAAQFHDVVRRGLDGVRVHSTDLAQLLGRPPTDMVDFVRVNAAQFA